MSRRSIIKIRRMIMRSRTSIMSRGVILRETRRIVGSRIGIIMVR